MVRAFLAIDLPGNLRAALGRYQDQLKLSGADVRWVPVGNVHLTLKFFGQIPEKDVDPICEAAQGVAGSVGPLELQLDGAGAFPNVRSPRVVWVGLGGDLEALGAFYSMLESAFAALGHLPEGRPFHPHLTLGRVRSPAGREKLTRLLQEVPPPECPAFQVGEVILFRSQLSPQGSTYTPLKVMPLGS